MKNKLTTKQILEYTEAQQTEEKLRKDENKSSNTHDDVCGDVYESKNDVYALTPIELDKSVNIPKFVTPETATAFSNFLVLVCQGNMDNISDFSRSSGVSRQTIYAWLAHKDTKIAINDMIKIETTKDIGVVYNKIKDNIDSNAAYGRLYLEKYQNWTANSKYNMPVQINFNFQGVVPDDDQVDADVIDVDEEAP